MASCAASRYPALCTLSGSRLSSRDTKAGSFWSEGPVTKQKLQARDTCLRTRSKGCKCVGFSENLAVCVYAFSLLPLKVQERRKRLCSGAYPSFPAPDRRLRRSAPAVEGYFCSRGALVKGFGEGVFWTREESGRLRAEAASDGRGFDGESSASDKERIQSGRAATTSGSNLTRERGPKQQLKDPPEAVEPAASSNGVGQKDRVGTGPEKTLLKKRGREVLKKLIGLQAAWPSAPLLALARQKKESEAKKRNNDVPKRKPRAKKMAGLSEGGAEGLGRGENGVKGEETLIEGGGELELGGTFREKLAAPGGSKGAPVETPGVQNGKSARKDGVSRSEPASPKTQTALTPAVGGIPPKNVNGADSEDGAARSNGSAGQVEDEASPAEGLGPFGKAGGTRELGEKLLVKASGLGGSGKEAGGENGAQNRGGTVKGDTSTLGEMSGESRKAIPLSAGDSWQEIVGAAANETGAAGLNGIARNGERKVPLEGEGKGEAESANGFARDKALRTVVEPQNRLREEGERQGRAPGGSRVEAKKGASETNGFGREDFLLRLERVQKGLGAKAKVLAREAAAAAAPDRSPTLQNDQSLEGGDKILLGLGALNDPLPPPAQGSRVERAGNWRSRRALKGVGMRSTTTAAGARAVVVGGVEMAGDGTPQDGGYAAGGAADWADGPLKRDANAAVAQMVASSKRFQRLRQLARASVKGGGSSEAVDGPVQLRDGNSQDGLGNGLREGLAAVERVVQNGTATAEGADEGKVCGEGLPQGLVEKEAELESENRGAEPDVLRDGSAANGRLPQTGAVKTGEKEVPGGRGGERANGVEHSVPAAMNGYPNGAAKEALAAGEAPAGRADPSGFAGRGALAASTNGHATPGALAAGEEVLQNGAVEVPGGSEEEKGVSMVEGDSAVKVGSVAVGNAAASKGSETEAVGLSERAAMPTAALNGHASSGVDAALNAERSENGAASRNGALNGVALPGGAKSERQTATSLQSSNGFGRAGGPLAKDHLEQSVRSPGGELHGSANGKVPVGALNGAASLETGSSVLAEGRQQGGADSTNGVALRSAPVLVAVSRIAEDGTVTGARKNLTLPEGVANAAVSRGPENGAGAESTEEASVPVPVNRLPPPLPIKKRKSAGKMIERSKPPGRPPGGRSDSSIEVPGRRTSAHGGSEDAPVLVTASRKIGEEAPAISSEERGGLAPPGGRTPTWEPPRNYTLEEDEKLFETLGFRLTGQEMSRIAEWLKSQEVPELKLARPRDRAGKYFLMPVVKAVEKHLQEHGRLPSENDLGVNGPAAPAEGVFTPGAAAGPAAGENGDEFFQEMSEELSADVVLQTQELLANQDPAGGSENVGNGTPAEKKAEFLDFFADDSSDSDVEILFQRAGLNTGGRRQRRLQSLEKAVIAEYLMGLSKQGGEPPRKEDWPCAPDGERYSKETLRGVWREADEMGGLPAYLKISREDEAIERLLVESLSRGRPLKGEDWRELTAEETRAVESMRPGERAPALEFMLGLLRWGERLDWKKHRDVWPRKVRTGHLMKAWVLLALVKVARRRGGLQAYLEESRRELERSPDSLDGPRASTSGASEPYDDLLESGPDSDMDNASEELSEFSPARASPFGTGGWKEARMEPPTPAASASATGVGWRAGSFARGPNSESKAPPPGGAQGGARQYDQSGGLGRSPTDSVGTPTRLFSPPSKPVDRPSPVDPDPSKIPRGFPVRRPKEPVPRDPGSGFATWRVPSSEPPGQISPSRTPPPVPASSKRGGMIRSSADRSALSWLPDGEFSPGGDSPQQSIPPGRESAPARRWRGLYDAKQPLVEPEGPVLSKVDSLPAHEREPTGNVPQNGASRELSLSERRRRRRLLGIKVQRNDDVSGMGNDVSGQGSDDVSRGGVFEVVGRQPRTMREVLSGYAQETVLVKAEELAQPVLLEDSLRASDEEGLLERLIPGQKSEMEEFKDTSKQYMRTWQDFQTWSDFFQFKNKRLPTVTDVESTCIPWLIEKAKAYVVLRKHMIKLAEGNEKLLTAMAAIQAELNKRSTASVAIGKSAEYQTKPASKRPAKRRGRPYREKHLDPVAGPIIAEAFENGDTF